MMRWIQKRSREQVVLLVVLGALVPTMMWGFVFAEVPEEAELSAVTREPVVAGAVAVEFPNADFAAYWSDERRLWSVEGGARLPLYVLKPPEVPPPPLCAPPLQPAPPLDLYYTGGGLDRFALGKPASEAPLPPERLAALLALQVPEPASRVDRRAERLHEWDVLVLVDDTRREGEILNTAADGSILMESPAGSGNRMTWKKERIKEVLHRYTNLERYETAHETLRASKDWKARRDLARRTLAWGMTAETVKLLEEARALEPRNDELIAELSDLYIELGDFDAAVALLGEASAEGRLKRDVHGVRLGWLLADIGLTEAALGAFASVAPLSAPARMGQAWMELRLGRFDAARASLRNVPAVGVEANLLKATIEWTGPATAGETLADRIARARAPMDAAVQAVAGGAAPGARHGGLLNRLVGVVTALEAKPGAAEFFANAAELDPASADPWTNLGWSYRVAGLPADAAALFGKALERNPAAAEAVIGQALCAADEASRESGLSAAEAIAPGHFYVSYVRAMTAADPAPHFAAVLSRRFDFGPVYLPAGLHALSAGRLLDAETLLRRGVVQDRRLGPALALATLLIRLDQTDEAREMLEAVTPATVEEQAAHSYARGYLEYVAGEGPADKRLPRVRAAYFEPAAAMGYAPAAEAVRLIGDWLSTEVVLDEGFDGEDGTDVGGRWSARLPAGASAVYESGGARLHGRGDAQEFSQLEAEFNGEGFWRMEATIRVGERAFGAAGVALYYSKIADGNWRGVYVALRQQGGRFGYRSGSAVSAQIAAGTLTGKENSELPAPRQKFTVMFQTVGEVRAEKVQILVKIDDGPDWHVLEDGIPLGKTDKRLRAAIFGGGGPGEEFSFHADDVTVYTRKRQ